MNLLATAHQTRARELRSARSTLAAWRRCSSQPGYRLGGWGAGCLALPGFPLAPGPGPGAFVNLSCFLLANPRIQGYCSQPCHHRPLRAGCSGLGGDWAPVVQAQMGRSLSRLRLVIAGTECDQGTRRQPGNGGMGCQRETVWLTGWVLGPWWLSPIICKMRPYTTPGFVRILVNGIQLSFSTVTGVTLS